eukprot:s6509_g4.t1
MELAEELSAKNCELQLQWIRRDLNQLADEEWLLLKRSFDPNFRVDLKGEALEWRVLGRLLAHATSYFEVLGSAKRTKKAPATRFAKRPRKLGAYNGKVVKFGECVLARVKTATKGKPRPAGNRPIDSSDNGRVGSLQVTTTWDGAAQGVRIDHMQPPAAAYAILSAVAKFEETSRTTKRKWPGRKALQRNGDTLFLLFIPSPGYNGMGVAVAVLAMAGLLTRVLRLEQPLHPLMSECLQWHSLYSYSFLTQAQPRQAAQWHNLLEKYLTSRACGLLKLLLRACACRTCEMQACTASLDENSRLKVGFYSVVRASELLLPSLGFHKFWIFAVFNALGAFASVVMPETKQETLEDETPRPHALTKLLLTVATGDSAHFRPMAARGGHYPSSGDLWAGRFRSRASQCGHHLLLLEAKILAHFAFSLFGDGSKCSRDLHRPESPSFHEHQNTENSTCQCFQGTSGKSLETAVDDLVSSRSCSSRCWSPVRCQAQECTVCTRMLQSGFWNRIPQPMWPSSAFRQAGEKQSCKSAWVPSVTATDCGLSRITAAFGCACYRRAAFLHSSQHGLEPAISQEKDTGIVHTGRYVKYSVVQGLRVVLATRKDSVHEVPKALSQHQFQAEERGALHGLRSQTELNGSPCSIVRYDQESRRWLVRLDIESEDNEILVSAANLLPLWLPEQAESLAEDKAESMPRGTESDGADARSTAAEDKTKRSAEGPGQRKAQEDAEGEATPAAPASKAKAGKGTVKMSHALVVTGFPLWDLQQITQYFARFGELRTILGANKNKGGKRKLLVAYCRKVNAKKSQQHVHGAEIDGNKLSAVFADDSSFANRQQEAKAAARPKNNS